MARTYSYDPGNVTEMGKDRMRFELGDTMVEGEADTTALTDEEIQAALDCHPGRWKRAKLMLLESLYRRFGYEVDTRTSELSLSLQERAKFWRDEYLRLKKELEAEGKLGFLKAPTGDSRPPYFYPGMQENPRTGCDRR